MSETIRAKREEIELGDRKIEVFQLPSGEYKLSQTQVTEVVGKPERSLRDFLGSKSLEALPYKDFRSAKFLTEGNNASINAIPIKLANAYWLQYSEGRILPLAFRALSKNITGCSKGVLKSWD